MKQVLLKSLCTPFFPAILATFVAGCSSSPAPDADTESKNKATAAMQAAIVAELDDMIGDIKKLQAALPQPKGRGWDKTQDAAAIATSKTEWSEVRTHYERIEGAIAPLFGEIDETVDQRYDYFVQTYGKDDNLFDGENVTGMHAIERILWADEITPDVTKFEAELKFKNASAYTAAAFPSSEAQSIEMRDKLVGRMLADTELLRKEFGPAKIDLSGAFVGLIGLMNEQSEKVVLASTFAEESRYSKRTMQDIRENMAGTKAVYGVFKPWLLSKTNADAAKDGGKVNAAIEGGFARIDAAYAKVNGASIPAVPATWSNETPSAADLNTEFGVLYTSIKAETDPSSKTSVVANMNAAGALLKFAEFKAE